MRIIVFTTCGGGPKRPFLLFRAEGGCEFRELPLVMPPSKVCPQCNAVVPIRLKVCRNRLKFALYNADRVNFKSRNYHVVAYNISILAEGLHFSALVVYSSPHSLDFKVGISLVCLVRASGVILSLLSLLLFPVVVRFTSSSSYGGGRERPVAG